MVAVIIQMINMTRKGGRTLKPANLDPSQTESPDIFDASDTANPPPKKNRLYKFENIIKKVIHLKGERCPKVICPVHISIPKGQDWVYECHVLPRIT